MHQDCVEVSASKATKVGHVNLDVLENTLSFYVRVLDVMVSQDLDLRLENLEVARGKGKITALFLIDSHPGIRPSVLAELTMKDRSAMGRILAGFDENGLIIRRTSVDDSRAQELFITPKGAELAAKVRTIVVSQSETFFDRIVPKNEQKALIAILKRAYHRLREIKK